MRLYIFYLSPFDWPVPREALKKCWVLLFGIRRVAKEVIEERHY